MENFIVIAILVLLVVGIVWYLARSQKRGETCIGCPYSKGCGGACGSKTNKK